MNKEKLSNLKVEKFNFPIEIIKIIIIGTKVDYFAGNDRVNIFQ